MRRKAKVQVSRDGYEESVRLLHVDKKVSTISALMRSLKHVKSSGPYCRDEMNER
jgi:hypothetical protein